MNVEVSFGGPEAAANDLEAASANMLEFLSLISLNMKVS